MSEKNRYLEDISRVDRDDWYWKIINDYGCIVRRTDGGWLCGYVRVSRDEKPTDLDCDKLYVHGGITFEGTLDHLGVNGYWIGFDCNHAGDWFPMLDAYGVYRDTEYVVNELFDLTVQLDNLEHASHD